ncbi:MAG TPA: 2-C-methyl-D-erythritol 2,4-cyclodiphosphate synthase [Candidatus Hydrogenedentes bacterium]|nr:2-C-methyl-D-erythritol 2,4-cyclodiphosphate synthase [Candidatus Hydrogenedentota bacterium]HNT87808.1 2-C-methyl-D-erythritol 2,4-cyclodiphosphate synthase [Candidatus Hydrogenedentota bacterium]
MIRIGIGYDLHRLIPGRPLVLGGVTIPHEKGLAGHSDADALCHAVTDAVLGALALGDIGGHFPDTDPRYGNANSLQLLEAVVRLAHNTGYRVVNVDANIIVQRPKMQPYIDAMRQRLAEALQTDKARVSVKAKTNENVGPEGREEAISAEAVVLLESG